VQKKKTGWFTGCVPACAHHGKRTGPKREKKKKKKKHKTALALEKPLPAWSPPKKKKGRAEAAGVAVPRTHVAAGQTSLKTDKTGQVQGVLKGRGFLGSPDGRKKKKIQNGGTKAPIPFVG